jgi:hypothetical protein
VVVNTYTAGSPAAPWAGVAVQHFTVPYGCIGSRLEFYCELTGGLGLVDHEVALQVYTADHQHLATGAVKVRDLPNGRGWVAVKGLHLKPDTYYAQLFTNSESLRPHLRAVLHSRSDYRGGCAAQGWKGGVPLGPAEDFEARLTYQRPGPPRLGLGDDPEFLVKQSRANYPIVLAEDAPLPEQTAARELRAHLRAISGVEPPIILETDYGGGPMIAVGFNKHLPAAMQPPAFGALQEQQLIIKGGPGTLLLAGAESCGPLYAVYEFLHRRAGTRRSSPSPRTLPTSPCR